MTSQTEKDKRIDAVADWLLEGMRYSDVLAKTCTEYKVCDRTARTYIGQANAIVREARMTMKEAEVREAIDCFKDTYQSARRKDDHSAATGAVRELVKLLGLAEPDKAEVKHDASPALMGVFAGVVQSNDKPA
jgi:hypothetical protein